MTNDIATPKASPTTPDHVTRQAADVLRGRIGEATGPALFEAPAEPAPEDMIERTERALPLTLRSAVAVAVAMAPPGKDPVEERRREDEEMTGTRT